MYDDNGTAYEYIGDGEQYEENAVDVVQDGQDAGRDAEGTYEYVRIA